MDEPVSNPNQPDAEHLQLLQLIVDLREKAFRQIIFGFLWWLGSAIAMYFALASTGSTIYWYGGALGSLFHWYRAGKMISATYAAGAKTIVRREAIAIALSVLLVGVSISKIVPEYFRTSTPTVGTCWGKGKSGSYVPIACWSSNAVIKTIAFSTSSDTCPPESDGYFDPSERESRVTCLANNR